MNNILDRIWYINGNLMQIREGVWSIMQERETEMERNQSEVLPLHYSF